VRIVPVLMPATRASISFMTSLHAACAVTATSHWACTRAAEPGQVAAATGAKAKAARILPAMLAKAKRKRQRLLRGKTRQDSGVTSLERRPVIKEPTARRQRW
jgi:hypothetical protein